MSSIYTGIIGGTLTATLALVSTGKQKKSFNLKVNFCSFPFQGKLSSLKFGVFGYLGSALASW